MLPGAVNARAKVPLDRQPEGGSLSNEASSAVTEWMSPPDHVQVTVSPAVIVVVDVDDAASVNVKSVTLTSCAAALADGALGASIATEAIARNENSSRALGCIAHSPSRRPSRRALKQMLYGGGANAD